MEPLSPRAANIQVKPTGAGKQSIKPVEAKRTTNLKEHAPKPPPVVVQPPIDEDSPPEDYRTGNHLGKGGFAVCYEGELQCSRPSMKDRIYALKIVPANMNHKKMEDKFRTELQIHAKLHHPNIVEFHRAFTFKDSTYVVLELCRSGSVMELVKKRGCLSLPEVRRLTVQLCGAVKYMHARNVIHRDLKMGNLFLDHDMNLKIGDFGLAAVLVSKSEYEGVYSKNFSRRTTLCGTPNYIAPEILEKAKGGHDHKVDIWAIGVILFAMITGFPPFQSTSQDEIYRKAKNVEYDWPESRTNSRRCHNDIPPEAKDLVACLLKVDAEARPNPDGIVSHDFFSMHGGNAMPLALDPSCRRQKPSWLLEATPRGDVMDRITPRLELRTLALQCGVGHLRGEPLPYEVVGDNVEVSLYKECVAEEHENKSPAVPLPDDKVYCSTTSLRTWPNRQSPSPDSSVSMTLVEGVENREPMRTPAASEVQPPIPAKTVQIVQPTLPRRGPVQSHAATLRQAHAGPKRTQGASKVTQEQSEPPAGRQRAPPRRLLKELPVRPNLASANSASAQGTAPQRQSSRLKRSTSANVDLSRPSAADQTTESDAPEPDQKRRESTAKNEARIAATVQEEIEEAILGQRGSRRLKRSLPKVSVRKSPRESSLIGPDEVAESLVGTNPKSVRSNLRKLHDELASSLNGSCRYGGDHWSIDAASKKSIEDRPVILKWVDYSHKFGIGYILENGTVGCILNSENGKPPSHVVIPRSENHQKNRRSDDYIYKHQVVLKDGAPVAFYEDCGEEGLQRVLVSPRKYQIREDRALTEAFRRGTDPYDSEKRERLYLWDKFARYMTQSLGRSESGDSSPDPLEPVGPFIRFYQRIGNVGIWGFGDGSFQFNFPDHTKLVVSPDGAWLDFYYLSIQSAQALKRGEVLEAASLMERSVLRYPTSVMLEGSYGDTDFKRIILENELREKVIFVKDSVATWYKAGGLGRTIGKQGIKWEGMSEKGGKLVWVTVGAYGGDQRKYERRAS